MPYECRCGVVTFPRPSRRRMVSSSDPLRDNNGALCSLRQHRLWPLLRALVLLMEEPKQRRKRCDFSAVVADPLQDFLGNYCAFIPHKNFRTEFHEATKELRCIYQHIFILYVMMSDTFMMLSPLIQERSMSFLLVQLYFYVFQACFKAFLTNVLCIFVRFTLRFFLWLLWFKQIVGFFPMAQIHEEENVTMNASLAFWSRGQSCDTKLESLPLVVLMMILLKSLGRKVL